MSPAGAPEISSLEFWAKPPDERERTMKRLRDEFPLSWQPQPEGRLMPTQEGSGGYWAAVRYDDIRQISRDPETFCSGKGVMLEDVPQELLDASQSFLPMDGEEHRSLRGLVSAGFTPRQVKHLEDGIREDAATIATDLAEHREGDFVQLVAKRLPLMTIMRMLGVPEADRERLLHHADAMVSWNDPDYLGGREPLAVLGEALAVLTQACDELIAERRREPGEDLLSALVEAEVGGERLSDQQISSFFVLISVAGNDTTRHTTAHAMLALSENPDQRSLLASEHDERIEDAVEEFVRWASPVMTFRRTATRDTELRGERITEGDKVVLFYPSGNRDERAIPDPGSFDISRRPNRHLGFGGGGPHYCMGAALARMQLKVLFGELLDRYPELEVADPDYLVGNFVNGISAMPMTLGRAA